MGEFKKILTGKDCRKGFHDFRVKSKHGSFIFEVCETCGEKEHYDGSSKTVMSSNRWRVRHKLALLQPFGATLKDFIYYYGDVKSNNVVPEVGSVIVFDLLLPDGMKKSWSTVKDLFKRSGYEMCLHKSPIEMSLNCCNDSLIIKRWIDFPLKDVKCSCGKNYFVRWRYEKRRGDKVSSEKAEGQKESLSQANGGKDEV